VNVGIPIYNYEFEGLSFPISLSYSGGNGVKPDEVPGWVGSGWNLQAGGAIHRTVRGKPDEALDFQTNIYNYYAYPDNLHPKKETNLSATDYSYFSNVNKLNVSNWSTQTYANTLFPSQVNTPQGPFDMGSYSTTVYNHHPTYDLAPDE